MLTAPVNPPAQRRRLPQIQLDRLLEEFGPAQDHPHIVCLPFESPPPFRH